MAQGSCVIEWNIPAVGALVQIGPEASRAFIRAYQHPMGPEDRLCAVFVVSRIKGVPEAQVFLESAMGRAGQEEYRAQAGLKFLFESAPSAK